MPTTQNERILNEFLNMNVKKAKTDNPLNLQNICKDMEIDYIGN